MMIMIMIIIIDRQTDRTLFYVALHLTKSYFVGSAQITNNNNNNNNNNDNNDNNNSDNDNNDNNGDYEFVMAKFHVFLFKCVLQ